MAKSKADIVMEKHAGIASKVGGAIWDGTKWVGGKLWDAIWGTTKATGNVIKKNPIPTATIVGGALATHYSLQQRNAARDELKKYMNQNANYSTDSMTDFDKITSGDAWNQALLTPKQKAGIAALPKNQQDLHRQATYSHNTTRYMHSLNPNLHKKFPGDANYLDSLYTVGALDPWKDNPNIVPKHRRK